MWFKNSIVRALIVASLPIIATVVDNFTGDWKIDGEFVNLYQSGKLWVLVLYVIFVVLIGYYAYLDNKKDKINMNLESQQREIDAYKRDVESLRDVFDFSQDAIDKLTKNFEKNCQLDLREWNFEAVATYICKGIYSSISIAAENGENFTVNIYVKTSENKKDYVTMIAHEGANWNDPPNILGVRRLLKQKNNVHYSMKQFIDNNPKINVLADKDSISRVFDKYKDSYNQYIGIPICSKGNNMISLIEIVAHQDSIIAKNRSDILEIVNKHVICYQYFALLAHKIEKNMTTTIDVLRAVDGGVENNEEC